VLRPEETVIKAARKSSCTKQEQQLFTINNVVIVAFSSKKPLHSTATILCLAGCPAAQQLMHHSAVNVYNPCMHSWQAGCASHVQEWL
jgi:hypothetical protein